RRWRQSPGRCLPGGQTAGSPRTGSRSGCRTREATRDKDLPGQLRALLPLFDSLIATRYVENPRSVPPEDIALAIAAIDGRTARITQDPAAALDLARRVTGPLALVCVTGSLFLAAETRAIMLGQPSVRPVTGVAI